MEPKIVDAQERKLVGLRIETTIAEDRPGELWRRFKPRVKEIAARANENFYSVQVFEGDLKFEDIQPDTAFEKWAAVEVNDLDSIPEGLEALTLPSGKYAVFIHKGMPCDFPRTARFIYGAWLPDSGFELNGRESFEVMGPDYLPTDPDAEEEVWVPLK